MNGWLKLILFFYCSGFLVALLVGFEGISGRNVTFKRIRATIVMALFSWFVLIYMICGDDSKNYKDF